MATHRPDHTVDRRAFLASTAAGAAVVTAAPTALGKLAQGGGLSADMSLAGGWCVKELRPNEAGAVRVVAQHAASGRIANVAICRHEANSGALASTGAVDLFIMNDGGNGKRRTPADEVQLVQHIARRLTGAEETLPGASRLLGRSERQSAFAPIDHLDPTAPTQG
jgi:hypothetical protein